MIWTLENVEELVNGRRPENYCGADQRKLNSRESADFDLAKHRGFCECGRQPSRELRNVWWRYCEVRRIAYLVVRYNRPFGSVALDLRPTGELAVGLPYLECIEDLLAVWRRIVEAENCAHLSAHGSGSAVFVRLPIAYLEPYAHQVLERVTPLVRTQIEAHKTPAAGGAPL